MNRLTDPFDPTRAFYRRAGLAGWKVWGVINVAGTAFLTTEQRWPPMETIMWTGVAAFVAALVWMAAPYHSRLIDHWPIIRNHDEAWH